MTTGVGKNLKMLACCGCLLIVCLLVTIGIVAGIQLHNSNLQKLAYINANESAFTTVNSRISEIIQKRSVLDFSPTTESVQQAANIVTLQKTFPDFNSAISAAQTSAGAVGETADYTINRSLQKSLLDYYQQSENYQLYVADYLKIHEQVLSMQDTVEQFLQLINKKIAEVKSPGDIAQLRQTCLAKSQDILKYDTGLTKITRTADNMQLMDLAAKRIKEESKFLQDYASLLQEYEQALNSTSQSLLDNVNVKAVEFNTLYRNAENKFNQDFSQADKSLNKIMANQENVLNKTAETIVKEIAQLKSRY